MPGTFKYCPLCSQPLIDGQRGGRDRKVCPDDVCGFVHWDNPSPVIGAIVEHGEDVLLVRNHGWPETWFGLVTGFLEREETPQEGILRELKEELGLEGEIVSLVGAYSFSMRHELIVVYHVRASGEVTLGEELAAYKAVPKTRLRPWPFGTGDAVRDWLVAQGLRKSET